jgi:hypothetical protein
MRTCKGRNERGEPCQAAPLRDGEFCVFHDPDHAESVQEARRLGGYRRRRESTLSVAFDFEGLSTLPEIRRLVEVAAFDVLGLENSIARARTLAYLAQVAGALFERSELEQRLEAIESTLGPRLMAPDFRRRQA